MKETYIVRIKRFDQPEAVELCQAQSTEAAAAVVKAILDTHDSRYEWVSVSVTRL